MESKTRHSYDSVIRFVKNNFVPNFTLEIIITDYETALRDVLISAFPEARSSGCWFHHNQVRIIYIKIKYYYFYLVFIYVGKCKS